MTSRATGGYNTLTAQGKENANPVRQDNGLKFQNSPSVLTLDLFSS